MNGLEYGDENKEISHLNTIVMKSRYTIYLVDAETLNVYGDCEYADDIEDAKKIAINLVTNTVFDQQKGDYDYPDAVVAAVDDNEYEMTKDWQKLAFGKMSVEELTEIAGNHFNGYTQININN